MRKVLQALTLVTVTLGLLLTTYQATGDDAADVEAVDRELEA